MAKKNSKEDNVKKSNAETFGLEELAERFGITRFKMDSLYAIKKIEKDQKLTLQEARKLFSKINI